MLKKKRITIAGISFNCFNNAEGVHKMSIYIYTLNLMPRAFLKWKIFTIQKMQSNGKIYGRNSLNTPVLAWSQIDDWIGNSFGIWNALSSNYVVIYIYIHIYIYIYIYILTSIRARCDTRSIFKRSLIGFKFRASLLLNLLLYQRLRSQCALLHTVKCQNSSIWTIDWALSGATTPGQSGPLSDGNERVLCISQISSITRTSPSDCLVS